MTKPPAHLSQTDYAAVHGDIVALLEAARAGLGMLYGIGTDICAISRMAAAVQRHGERFAQRVLGPSELAEYRRRLAKVERRGIHYLATRFAAKEAFAKAIGLGMRHPMGWQACEVISNDLGRPSVQLHGELAAWFQTQGWQAHLSLSDEAHHALAFVVVEHRRDSYNTP